VKEAIKLANKHPNNPVFANAAKKASESAGIVFNPIIKIGGQTTRTGNVGGTRVGGQTSGGTRVGGTTTGGTRVGGSTYGGTRVGGTTTGGTRVGGQMMEGQRTRTGNVEGTRLGGNGNRIRSLINEAGGKNNILNGINSLRKTNGNVMRARAMSGLPLRTFTNINILGGPNKARNIISRPRLLVKRRSTRRPVPRKSVSRKRSAPRRRSGGACPLIPRSGVNRNKLIKKIVHQVRKKDLERDMVEVLKK